MRISDWSSDVCSSDLALPRSRIVEVPDRGVRAREVRRTKDKDRKDRTRRRSAGEIPPGASYRQCAHPTGGGALRARALDLPRDASHGGTGRGACRADRDRQSVGQGKSVSIRVNCGGRRIATKKEQSKQKQRT